MFSLFQWRKPKWKWPIISHTLQNTTKEQKQTTRTTTETITPTIPTVPASIPPTPSNAPYPLLHQLQPSQLPLIQFLLFQLLLTHFHRHLPMIHTKKSFSCLKSSDRAHTSTPHKSFSWFSPTDTFQTCPHSCTLPAPPWGRGSLCRHRRWRQGWCRSFQPLLQLQLQIQYPLIQPLPIQSLLQLLLQLKYFLTQPSIQTQNLLF